MTGAGVWFVPLARLSFETGLLGSFHQKKIRSAMTDLLNDDIVGA